MGSLTLKGNTTETCAMLRVPFSARRRHGVPDPRAPWAEPAPTVIGRRAVRTRRYEPSRPVALMRRRSAVLPASRAARGPPPFHPASEACARDSGCA